MFGELHDHRFVGLGVRGLRRQACECLFQQVLRAAWQLRHLLLERTGCGHSALPGANVPKTRQRAENPVDLFFAGRGMATASVALSRTESCTERRERANSAVSRYARNAWSYCGRLRSARPRSRTLTAFGALRS